EFKQVGGMIVEVLDGLSAKGEADNAATEAAVKEKVHALTAKFPIYVY
ncbi:MAG TPA: serine hydroxymethyltransferase, partial [Methylocystis sp.]|nr:serine hydroxymethyltransferase [Methylocystis sp.]